MAGHDDEKPHQSTATNERPEGAGDSRDGVRSQLNWLILIAGIVAAVVLLLLL